MILAASDTSDGLLGAIENIGRLSRCGFVLELGAELLAEEVRHAAVLPRVASAWNLFFTWGDWSVAVVFDGARAAEFERICDRNGLDWRPLGTVVADVGRIDAVLDGRDYVVTPVRNENFVDRGFNAGLQGHLDYILSTQILERRTQT